MTTIRRSGRDTNENSWRQEKSNRRRTYVNQILSRPWVAAVEPASTLATLDNFQNAAGLFRLLISKAVRVPPPFGTSAANTEVSAREVIVPFAWIGSSN